MPVFTVPADAKVPTSPQQGVAVRLRSPSRAGAGVTEVLDGQLGISGLRALVNNPLLHGLGDLLRSCGRGAEQAAVTGPLRTKYKPGRKLTAYYQLHFGSKVRPIALTWLTAPPDHEADAEDQAIARNLVEPFERLSARTESGQQSLLIAPLDPALPQLARLHDPEHLSRMLASLSVETAGRFGIEAVRYRPGQRHVLRVAAEPPTDARPGSNAVYVKIDRDNRGARAVRFADEVGPLLAERTPAAHLVRSLGYAADDQAACWRGVAGATLSAQVCDPKRAAPAFSLLGQAIRTLHGLDLEVATNDSVDRSVAPSPVRAELASTLGAGAHVTGLLPAVGASFRRTATEAVERLESLPAEEPRLGHGDLKCDNLIADGGEIWLLDLDRTGLAEPAMDLGKLLADVAWWGRAHAVDVNDVVEAFLAGYGPCDPARLARARLIAVVYCLKLAARRIPVHAPDWDAQVTRQVDEAAARLREEASR